MASNSTVIVDDKESRMIGKLAVSPNSAGAGKQGPGAQRETGDQVNRFLLCRLIAESAKRIKASAERAGESLPMTMIVRGVLRAYRLAAKEEDGPFAEMEPDFARLRGLNETVLRDEIARHSRDRVKNDEQRLAHAERQSDDTRIKSEKERLRRSM